MKEHVCENVMPWKIATGVFALLFIATLLIFGTAKPVTTTTEGTQAAVKADMTVLANDVVKGSSNAKITIIEYSDPSCPFCAAAAGGSEMVAYMKSRSPDYEAAVPGIIKNYVDTGKARLVFRFFPGHGNGEDAMKIMLCANEQDKFWEVHDVLFNNQALMNSGTIDVAGMKKLAVDNGVDSSKLEACLEAKKYDAKLANDVKLGQASGVQGTPAFAVNGQMVSGAVPYSTFQKALDTIV